MGPGTVPTCALMRLVLFFLFAPARAVVHFPTTNVAARCREFMNPVTNNPDGAFHGAFDAKIA